MPACFTLLLPAWDLPCAPEDVTNRGRADFTVFARERIFIFEFKVTKNEDPLQQIKGRGYFEKYLAANQEIVLVGIVFDTQKRNIAQMLWEVLRQR